jgi:hypothetical protein
MRLSFTKTLFYIEFAINASESSMEQHALDTNAGKQLSSAATEVYLTLVLKK